MSTKFGFATIGDEVVSAFAEQVHGLLITGPSPGGLGAEVAISLARASEPPDTILLAGRGSSERYGPVVEAIRSADVTGSIEVRVYAGIDMSSLASVRTGVSRILAEWEDSERGIDVLINNAGVCALVDREMSADGIERHFATNHVGPFLFTNMLMRAILKTKTPRVVNVSSSGHRSALTAEYNDYNFEITPYSWEAAYGQSKLANIHFSQQLARILGSQGLTSISLDPGLVYATQIFRALNSTEMVTLRDYANDLGLREKTTAQGTATILLAALDPGFSCYNGAYLADCEIAPVPGVGAQTMDGPEVLWELSERLVNEKFKY